MQGKRKYFCEQPESEKLQCKTNWCGIWQPRREGRRSACSLRVKILANLRWLLNGNGEFQQRARKAADRFLQCSYIFSKSDQKWKGETVLLFWILFILAIGGNSAVFIASLMADLSFQNSFAFLCSYLQGYQLILAEEDEVNTSILCPGQLWLHFLCPRPDH